LLLRKVRKLVTLGCLLLQDDVGAYEKDVFSDTISSDVTDRAEGKRTGLRGAAERKLNTETFGATSLDGGRRRGGRRRGGRGYGGGRGRGRDGGGEADEVVDEEVLVVCIFCFLFCTA
jgi:hypothetical protein